MIIRTKFNGYSPDGSRRYYKGGGGAKYDNLEQLYAIQAEQAKGLMDQANQNVYPAYNQLLDEAKGTGSIANQELAAGRAGADVMAAQGGAKKQLEQQLTSMGVNPNDQKFANTMAAMDLDAAGQKAAAMTGARDKTRDLGFAKMTDTVNAGMGIGSNAVAALNSAGGMANNIAGLQQQGQANRDANLGNIAALGTRLLMNKGGLVPKKGCSTGGRGLKIKGYNRGGIIGAMQGIKAAPPPAGASAPSPLSRAASQVATGGGAPGAGKMIEGVGNLVGKVAPEAGNSISSFGTGLRLGDKAQPAIEAFQAAAAPVGGAAGAATAGEVAGAAAQHGITAAGEQAAMLAAQEAGMGTLAAAGAETAGATAASMGAGSAIGGALSAAMPWVGGALLIGSALDLFADGGQVKSHKIGGQQGADGVAESDTGGKVDGPGGPKEDKVLARLSPGEFVMPVATVKMYGLDRLEKMRAIGLRHEKQLGIR